MWALLLRSTWWVDRRFGDDHLASCVSKNVDDHTGTDGCGESLESAANHGNFAFEVNHTRLVVGGLVLVLLLQAHLNHSVLHGEFLSVGSHYRPCLFYEYGKNLEPVLGPKLDLLAMVSRRPCAERGRRGSRAQLSPRRTRWGCQRRAGGASRFLCS